MLDQTSTPTMSITSIKIGKRARRDLGDIVALADDIDAVGLLQPIVVTPDGRLIAGERRLSAWKRSKFRNDPIPVHLVDLKAIARGEWSENAHRKSFTPSEAVALARAIEGELRAEALARQLSGRRVEKRMRTRDVLALACGLSGRTLEKAQQVVEAAEREPDKFSGVAARMDDTRNVDEAYRTVLGRVTQRLLQQPSVFVTTKIGRVVLGELSVPELRWLIGFFTALGETLPVAPDDGMNIAKLLTVKEVNRAIKRGDRLRASR